MPWWRPRRHRRGSDCTKPPARAADGPGRHRNANGGQAENGAENPEGCRTRSCCALGRCHRYAVRSAAKACRGQRRGFAGRGPLCGSGRMGKPPAGFRRSTRLRGRRMDRGPEPDGRVQGRIYIQNLLNSPGGSHADVRRRSGMRIAHPREKRDTCVRRVWMRFGGRFIPAVDTRRPPKGTLRCASEDSGNRGYGSQAAWRRRTPLPLSEPPSCPR